MFSERFVKCTIAFSAAAIASALREYKTDGLFKTQAFSYKNSKKDYDDVLNIVEHAWNDEVGSARCQSFFTTLKKLASAQGRRDHVQ